MKCTGNYKIMLEKNWWEAQDTYQAYVEYRYNLFTWQWRQVSATSTTLEGAKEALEKWVDVQVAKATPVEAGTIERLKGIEV